MIEIGVATRLEQEITEAYQKYVSLRRQCQNAENSVRAWKNRIGELPPRQRIAARLSREGYPTYAEKDAHHLRTHVIPEQYGRVCQLLSQRLGIYPLAENPIYRKAVIVHYSNCRNFPPPVYVAEFISPLEGYAFKPRVLFHEYQLAASRNGVKSIHIREGLPPRLLLPSTPESTIVKIPVLGELRGPRYDFLPQETFITQFVGG